MTVKDDWILIIKRRYYSMRKEHRTLVDIPIEERREIAICYSQSFQWPNTSELCRERDITSTTLRNVLDFAIQDELVDLETARAIADAAANTPSATLRRNSRRMLASVPGTTSIR